MILWYSLKFRSCSIAIVYLHLSICFIGLLLTFPAVVQHKPQTMRAASVPTVNSVAYILARGQPRSWILYRARHGFNTSRLIVESQRKAVFLSP
jgi:hypothetical protein